MTREAAAAELSCSVKTIDRLRTEGKLDDFKLSERGGVRILTASLEAFVEGAKNRRRARNGAPEPASSGLDVSNVRASVRAGLRARKGARG